MTQQQLEAANNFAYKIKKEQEDIEHLRRSIRHLYHQSLSKTENIKIPFESKYYSITLDIVYLEELLKKIKEDKQNKVKEYELAIKNI